MHIIVIEKRSRMLVSLIDKIYIMYSINKLIHIHIYIYISTQSNVS